MLSGWLQGATEPHLTPLNPWRVFYIPGFLFALVLALPHYHVWMPEPPFCRGEGLRSEMNWVLDSELFCRDIFDDASLQQSSMTLSAPESEPVGDCGLSYSDK